MKWKGVVQDQVCLVLYQLGVGCATWVASLKRQFFMRNVVSKVIAERLFRFIKQYMKHLWILMFNMLVLCHFTRELFFARQLKASSELFLMVSALGLSVFDEKTTKFFFQL